MSVLPSYVRVPASSPELPDDPGLVVKIERTHCRKGEPAPMFGAYTADAALTEASQGVVGEWVTLFAACRDRPAVRSAPALSRPSDPGTPVPCMLSPESKTSGWFAVDLRKHLELEPGRWWVWAALLDTLCGPFELTLEGPPPIAEPSVVEDDDEEEDDEGDDTVEPEPDEPEQG